MRTALRLVGCTAALALAFGAAWHVGAVTGVPAWSVAEPVPARSAGPPVPDPPPPASASRTEPAPLGLPATADGYTLLVQDPAFIPGRTGELVFTVTGPDGRAVRWRACSAASQGVSRRVSFGSMPSTSASR